MSIYPSSIKRVYDFITLGKLKWLLFLLVALTGVVSGVLYQYEVGFNYLVPKSVVYYPHDIYYWWPSGHLPYTWQGVIVWQNILWVESDLYGVIGVPLNVLTILVFLIAYLRGE